MPGRNPVQLTEFNWSKGRSKNKTARETIMTAQQYLLSQAEHCRRTAPETADPFVADGAQASCSGIRAPRPADA
jgi:hypothetical protein